MESIATILASLSACLAAYCIGCHKHLLRAEHDRITNRLDLMGKSFQEFDTRAAEAFGLNAKVREEYAQFLAKVNELHNATAMRYNDLDSRISAASMSGIMKRSNTPR